MQAGMNMLSSGNRHDVLHSDTGSGVMDWKVMTKDDSVVTDGGGNRRSCGQKNARVLATMKKTSPNVTCVRNLGMSPECRG